MTSSAETAANASSACDATSADSYVILAESSSIHSIRVRCAAGKFSVAKASMSAVVKLSSPRIWIFSGAGSSAFEIVVSLGVERIGFEVSGC